MNLTTNDVYDIVLVAYENGMSIVPVKEDGTKAPDVNWLPYQNKRPSLKMLKTWFEDKERHGLYLICGAVSGNLEMLEWETAADYSGFHVACERAGIGELLNRVLDGYFEKAPGGGNHTLYRCDEIAGNTKLANSADNKTMIETRGEGGGVVIAPSHGSVHQSGKAYELISGGLEFVLTITPEERTMLHDIARSLDERVLVERTVRHNPKQPEGERPGDLDAAAHTWAEVLEPAGWRWVYEHGEEDFWRRPGKNIGVSATTNYQGTDLLKVFSSSTGFSTETTYSKFAVYALLMHGGDFAAAARQLGYDGYSASPQPGAMSAKEAGITPQQGATLVVRKLADVEEEHTSWLWEPYIPRGKITFLSGDPGLGKSELILALCSQLTDPVLFFSAEDGAADTIKPRFRKVGGDMNMMSILDGVDTPKGRRLLDLSRDVPLIDEALSAERYSLLILDPINAFLPGIDAHRDNDVRSVLGPLSKIAEARNVAVVCIRHLNKSKDGTKAIYRGQGSIGFTGAARSELLVARNTLVPSERIMFHIKSNVGPLGPAQAFTIRHDPEDIHGAPLFEWLGERQLEVEDMLDDS